MFTVTSRIFDDILLFFVYACLGWGCEVAFAACKQGRFVNRGFLNGPVCPIYGFGVIGVVLALAPVSENPILLYLGSVVLTTLIEWLTGFALEKLFHARWWDYSNMPLNIMGYVCLLFSVVWGLACMAIVRWVHPLFVTAVERLPDALCICLDAVFTAVFLADLFATVSAVRRLSDQLKVLSELGGELRAISDDIGRHISDSTLAARKRVVDRGEALNERREQLQSQFEQAENQFAQWLEQHRAQMPEWSDGMRERLDSARVRLTEALEGKAAGTRRLLTAFPNLRSNLYQEALENLRELYEKRRRQ